MKIGQRVEVCINSGLDSGRKGTIVPRSRLKTDGRGVPLILGHYKPFNARLEHVIEDDDGEIFTMFKSRLIPERN